jgi:hypothetical protein
MLPWTRWIRLLNLRSTLTNRVPARKPAKRRPAGRLGVEHLETRLVPSAIVTTDRQDYAPGTTAIFTAGNDANPGLNFQPGETIHFHIDRTDGVPVSSPPAIQDWNVTDGVGGFSPYQDAGGQWWYPDTDAAANGQVGTTWYVDPQFAGASLELTVTGQSSGAVARADFTDGSVQTTMVLDGVTSTTTDSFTLKTSNYNLVNNQLVADTNHNRTATVTVGGNTNVPTAGDQYELLNASRYGNKTDAAGHPLTMFSVLPAGV